MGVGGVNSNSIFKYVILWILAQIDEEIDGAVEDYEDVWENGKNSENFIFIKLRFYFLSWKYFVKKDKLEMCSNIAPWSVIESS